MDREKIMRINELARKQKLTGLTEEELSERKRLRSEYLSEFRDYFKSMLDNIEVEDPDGTRHALHKRGADKT